MHQTNLLDETLDKNQTHHYNLFMQCCTGGISFCLLDTIKNKFIAFRHYPVVKTIKPEDITCIIAADDLMKLTYKSSSLILTGGHNTLVPAEYFDEKAASDYYRFNFGVDNEPVIFNKLEEIQAVNIFSYDHVLMARFREYFPELRVFHRTTPFITNLIQESSKGGKPKLFVAVEKEIADIGIAQSRKLEFFNSFRYREVSDILYYIMSVLDRHNLPAAGTEVFMSVDADKREEVFSYLNIYLNQLKTIKPAEKYTYSYVLDEFKVSGFANLFNLSLCV